MARKVKRNEERGGGSPEGFLLLLLEQEVFGKKAKNHQRFHVMKERKATQNTTVHGRGVRSIRISISSIARILSAKILRTETCPE